MPAEETELTFAIVGTRYASLDLEERQLADRKVSLVRTPGTDAAELKAAIKDTSVILVGGAAQLTADVLEAGPKLKGVVRYGIGVDNVDLEACERLGIRVANVPDYCIDEVSTHAVALILAVSRKIVASSEWVKEGGWGIASLRPMHAPRAQIVGLLGLGRIGLATARKLKPFGFTLIGHDPYVSSDRDLGVRLVSKEELFDTSDYVSLHLPLTPQSRHTVGRAEFARMKDTAVIVNTSRGGLIDEAALSEALAGGVIGGAALDVLDGEPPKPDRAVLKAPNLLLTPHTAWYTDEAEEDLRLKGLAEALRIVDGEKVLNPVAAV